MATTQTHKICGYMNKNDQLLVNYYQLFFYIVLSYMCIVQLSVFLGSQMTKCVYTRLVPTEPAYNVFVLLPCLCWAIDHVTGGADCWRKWNEDGGFYKAANWTCVGMVYFHYCTVGRRSIFWAKHFISSVYWPCLFKFTC